MFEIYKRTRRRYWPTIIGLLLVLLVGILFYPVRYEIVPAWKVQVVDAYGAPLPHTFVRQNWQDYSVESVGFGHKADSETDENGFVSFPERVGRASYFSRAFGFLSGLVSLHGSSGPYAYISAYGEMVDGKRWEGSVSYRSGAPLPDRLETSLIDLFP